MAAVLRCCFPAAVVFAQSARCLQKSFRSLPFSFCATSFGRQHFCYNCCSTLPSTCTWNRTAWPMTSALMFSSSFQLTRQGRSQGFFLCYRCLPDLTQVSIVLSVSFHIPALAQGRSALFTSRQSMGRGLDGLFSHLAMKQRQWQHTMAWWWTNIRSNTWDDLPSDKDLKSSCVSFWCCLKSLKRFETTNQIKCSQLGKQRQASPKKGPVASHGSHRCRACYA